VQPPFGIRQREIHDFFANGDGVRARKVAGFARDGGNAGECEKGKAHEVHHFLMSMAQNARGRKSNCSPRAPGRRVTGAIELLLPKFACCFPFEQQLTKTLHRRRILVFVPD
jgi:hypothetical protein